MADSDVSDSSDEEFLTLGAGKGGETLDREALVRKKLLENFYGRAAVADAAVPDSMDNDDDDEFMDDDDAEAKHSPSKKHVIGNAMDAEDLDSPAYDAEAQTRHHVINSSMEALLDTEEKLALSVRTLDTEMQALVYENYTRFIDATDAIRSIGVNVKANEQGLDRLATGIASIDESSRSIEESVGSLRDQIAEKIRIKRLLTRLDTLLKLPQTLREQIAAGNYRSACKQYLQASSILRKHSDGFESLKTIEMECNSILDDLRKDLDRKLSFWSGRVAIDENEPQAPKSIRDIFECSGTLYMLHMTGDMHQNDEYASVLQQMSLSASMRFLDRQLDSHLIEIQEQRYNTLSMDPSAMESGLGGSINSIRLKNDVDLIPGDVLDAILEVARQWASCFGDAVAGNDDITMFVSEAFASFLMQVRTVLLEETMFDDENEGFEKDVSVSLSILVRSVQEVAQGLAQDDVRVSPVYANSLIEQAKSLSDTLVRRRVDQRFMCLRRSIAQNCLLPFVVRATQERADCISSGKAPLGNMIQISNATLSDCVQLIDDTVRSIILPEDASSDASTAPEFVILKQAVRASMSLFISWLANAFEMLVGCESCEPADIIDVKETEERILDHLNQSIGGYEQPVVPDDVDRASSITRAVASMIDKAYKDILEASNMESGVVHSDFILTVAELCRLAHGSLSDMLELSVADHLVGHRKKSKGMFEGEKSKENEFNAIAQRFEIASSRLLALYSLNRGSEIGHILIEKLLSRGTGEAGEDVSGPCDSVLRGLELVRDTAIECSEVFGEHNWIGRFPDVRPDSFASVTQRSEWNRKTGLHLDVERMFKEKVRIYPLSSEIISRSPVSILFLVFKVSIRMLLEVVRSITLTGSEYLQFQVDLAFLKFLVPYYVKSDFTSNGSNASASLMALLSEVMLAAGERCIDVETVDNDQLKHQSSKILSRFMAGNEKNKVLQRIVIKPQSIN